MLPAWALSNDMPQFIWGSNRLGRTYTDAGRQQSIIVGLSFVVVAEER